ncbi:DgyrCDS11897 [Dimorphilus gyrociliatus]|uniref:DgyrCDS11897 n=2 Tax=Dimorphilus gyrociliatus TaxID=2664684 RepID=A0A7I8W4T7_9ANNE|nr:DgyrCDS11897 [Dimorphilus gyrociliatus]
MIAFVFVSRIVGLLLGIFAFSTTTSHSTTSIIHVHCPIENSMVQININVSFPYNIASNGFKTDPCNPKSADSHPYGSYAFQSIGFVVLAILSSLVCLLGLIVYICFDEAYRENYKLPNADFLLSVVIVCLWIVCTTVWADGFVKIKHYIDLQTLRVNGHLEGCKDLPHKCITVSHGKFASIYASLVNCH